MHTMYIYIEFNWQRYAADVYLGNFQYHMSQKKIKYKPGRLHILVT